MIESLPVEQLSTDLHVPLPWDERQTSPILAVEIPTSKLRAEK